MTTPAESDPAPPQTGSVATILQIEGAIIYNAAHTYLVPCLLVGLWLIVPEVEVLRIAAVWSAHIGLDRMLGYGLKYRTAFKHTHLHRA